MPGNMMGLGDWWDLLKRPLVVVAVVGWAAYLIWGM